MEAPVEGIGLSEALEVLRSELAAAHDKATGQDVQFPIDTLTVELSVGVTKSADGRVGVKVPVLGELGGSAGYARESIQTITLVLAPPVDREGHPIKVAARTEKRKSD
jgi:hypothetical protein